MDNVKGNAALNVGYSCKQRELVKGWRAIWSETRCEIPTRILRAHCMDHPF